MTQDEIERLQAGRELDALIAEHVLKMPFRKPTHGRCCTCQNCGNDYDSCGGGCYFSTDIAAAWQVVERLKKQDYRLRLSDQEDEGYVVWAARFYKYPQSTNLARIGGETAPLAICRAALKAVNQGSE